MTSTSAMANEILEGAVDTHVHSAPDMLPRFPRKVDDFRLIEQAEESGMAAVVIKNHLTLTADRAQLVQKSYSRIRVFGGLVLNNAIGGLNPLAVQAALGFGARVIWMPTISAAHHIKRAFVVTAAREGDPGITIIDANGELRPEVVEILRMIAQADAVLETGHLSPAESKVLITQARRHSVHRIIVTHPESHAVKMSIADQREIAAPGVYFERCWIGTTHNPPVTAAHLAEAIQSVGPESTIMATDFGQAHNPAPVEGLRSFIESMLDHGFSPAQVRLMVQENPSTVLGL